MRMPVKMIATECQYFLAIGDEAVEICPNYEAKVQSFSRKTYCRKSIVLNYNMQYYEICKLKVTSGHADNKIVVIRLFR